jgi:hypothetical protein
VPRAALAGYFFVEAICIAAIACFFNALIYIKESFEQFGLWYRLKRRNAKQEMIHAKPESS